ncbi:hypothetical protein [Calothrix sp. PCC 7507]|uniref:hypothetical protein n=1 Tax=Calothrix sp. PCC 7507 TaxID=99598 RepID=UPI00029F006C|nr:hypothetical protein [Calothrix sp. PCC 7507]AFY31968.1 hypothetical protein Cal7507_1504 [Calothrix sp. PCC 7507]
MKKQLLKNSVSQVLAQALLSSSLLALASQVVLADQRDFKVYNRTGSPIVNLYVARSTTKEWEEDVLNNGVLNSGEAQEITFSGYGQNECYFDIKAKFEDGQVVEDYKINLCETNSYTFSDN